MLYQYRTIANNVMDLYHGELGNTETVMRRIKILTKAGINEYTNIVVNRPYAAKLTVLDARTIRKDGSVVDLKASDIKELDLQDAEGNYDRYQQLRFSIPGVEVGDEIETVYSLQKSGLQTGRDVYMQSYLPVRHSVLVLSLDKGIRTELRSLNGVHEPKVTESMEDFTYRWEMKDLGSLGDESNALRSTALPYVSFVVRELDFGGRRYPVVPASIDTYYDTYIRSFGITNGTEPAVRKWVDGIRSVHAGESNVQVLEHALKELHESFAVVVMPTEEADQPLSVHLQQKRLDEWSLERLVQQVFDETKVQYWFCFGRNRLDGPIETSFVAPHTTTTTFFAYNDDQEHLHYYIPASPQRNFEIDELPWYLEGTRVLMQRRKSTGALETESLWSPVPVSSMNDNKHSQHIDMDITLTGGPLHARHRETWCGAWSGRYRSPMLTALRSGNAAELLDHEDLDQRFDSVSMEKQEHTAPYSFTMRYLSTSPSPVQTVEEGVISVDLAGLLHHELPDKPSANRSTDYHVPFQYIDEVRLFLHFDTPVSIMDELEFGKREESAWGVHILSVKQLDERTVVVTSSLNTKKDKLTPAEAKELAGLLDRINASLTTDLLVKAL
ncbi:MAG: DUF3857 domain-containing protein [Bacteroidetes bacterium]|nr:DUF3857 domain-containing protein [Bacteroidota bacterium]